MNSNIIKNISIILLLLFVSVVTTGFAQENTTCQILKKNSDGSYIIKVGDEELIAITPTMERKMLKMHTDLKAAEQKLAAQDTLMKTYHKTFAKYDSTMRYMKDYIVELEDILNGYKGLLKDYKKMKTPWVTVNWGIGATSGDNKPAIMMGLNIRNLQLTSFVQERNSGILVGTKFKIF